MQGPGKKGMDAPSVVMNSQDTLSQTQSNSPSPDALWTIDDVARYVRCSVRHVATLREQGLPYRKLGHLVRFDPELVKQWFVDP